MNMKKIVIVTFTCLMMAILSNGCSKSPRRYASVIGVKEDSLDKYKDLHANPWPQINKKIKECNIQNYSIYLTQFPDGNYYLFSYFEYIGDDFGADMANMAADPTTQKWWKETDPCQLPLDNRLKGERWKSMEEVYHLD